MTFNGKSTFDGGVTLPELAEDLSPMVGLISPFDTPLLDAIGAPATVARSTIHQWLEDRLNATSTTIDEEDGYDDEDTVFTVADGRIFRPGDVVRINGTAEVVLVASVDGNDITVQRGYGGTTAAEPANGTVLVIVGRSALEGGDAPPPANTLRQRRTNFTQIFTETVAISGTLDALTMPGAGSEYTYQATNRLRELMRQLEQSVLCGVASADYPQGSAAVRRTMGGILSYITGEDAVREGASGNNLDEARLNTVLKKCWERGGRPNAIVCSGAQKRRLSGLVANSQQYRPEDSLLRRVVDSYESDFGLCRVILSRWVPADMVLVLDLDRIQVLPLQGRSFQVRPLADTGDSRRAQITGEYTMEILNAGDGGHGLLYGLSTT